MGPAAVDALFGQGHAGRHGEDELPEPARLVGEIVAFPLARRVDGQERLLDEFHQEEHHQGRAGEERLDGAFLLLSVQNPVAQKEPVLHAAERGAAGVELLRQQPAGDVGLLALAPGIEAPALLPVALVPEIALGAGHAGAAFHAERLGGQAAGLGPDAHPGLAEDDGDSLSYYSSGEEEMEEAPLSME